MMAGGLHNAQPADQEVQNVVDAVKGEVESKLNKKLNKFQAISYRSQVVAGMNYFVKVEIDDDIVHLRIYNHFSGKTELHGVQQGKTRDEPIEFFQQQ
ncbi:hypothetical protein ABK040_013369 [Willaertia magna]